jgi:hypothetical protein
MASGHSAKRRRLVGLLSVGLAALLGGIAFLSWQDAQVANADARNADDIHTITVTFADDKFLPIVLKKQGAWQLESPIKLPANTQRITPLLTVYTNPDPGYSLSEVDMEATGLNQPEVTVLFNDYPVKIGQVAIDGSKRHALHGDRVRFVPDWVLDFLQGGVSALADLRVWGDSLTGLTFADDTEANVSVLEQATELSAQQLVPWPRDPSPDILTTHTLRVQLNGQATQTWQVFVTERYAAFQATNSQYAYIVSVDDVPWLPPNS